jgi:hypothetical protein
MERDGTIRPVTIQAIASKRIMVAKLCSITWGLTIRKRLVLASEPPQYRSKVSLKYSRKFPTSRRSANVDLPHCQPFRHLKSVPSRAATSIVWP